MQTKRTPRTRNAGLLAARAQPRRILLLVWALLSAAWLACGAVSGPAPSLAGEYDVRGTNPEGGAYSGEARIAEAGGQYSVIWYIAGETYEGTGQLRGDTFEVKWSAGQASGTATYTVKTNGVLDGTWALDGIDGQGTETLTPK